MLICGPVEVWWRTELRVKSLRFLYGLENMILGVKVPLFWTKSRRREKSKNVTLTLMCSLHKCWADSMISSNYNVEGNGGWSSFCCRPRVAAWRLWSLSIELFIQAHNLFVTGKVQCGKIRRRNFQRPNVSVEGWNYRFVISFKTWLFVKSHK